MLESDHVNDQMDFFWRTPFGLQLWLNRALMRFTAWVGNLHAPRERSSECWILLLILHEQCGLGSCAKQKRCLSKTWWKARVQRAWVLVKKNGILLRWYRIWILFRAFWLVLMFWSMLYSLDVGWHRPNVIKAHSENKCLDARVKH